MNVYILFKSFFDMVSVTNNMRIQLQAGERKEDNIIGKQEHIPAFFQNDKMLNKSLASSQWGYPINTLAQEFIKKYYPTVSGDLWNNWKWQLQHTLKSYQDLEGFMHLSKSEKSVLREWKTTLPINITPYYSHLINKDNTDSPFRRAVVPVIAETLLNQGEGVDPLNEEGTKVAPHVIHRYPDRVLFLATSMCATYCRYCTRSRLVGSHNQVNASIKSWSEGISYIAENTNIRDVLISGGDPLILGDNKIEWLLSKLRKIPHIEIIRIGTKVPAVLPQRITPSLINILKKYHPLWMSLHFMHPGELTLESFEACNRLADAGIPLGSQTVLLKGINDSARILGDLFTKLLKFRVRPYYLYQCDPIIGSAHFRTSVQKGLDIMERLQGFISGYAIPTYVVDAPRGGGKIPLFPDRIICRKENKILVRNYKGEIFEYPDMDQVRNSKYCTCSSSSNIS